MVDRNFTWISRKPCSVGRDWPVNRQPPDFAFNDDKSARPRLVRVNLVIELCQLRIASWTKVRARLRPLHRAESDKNSDRTIEGSILKERREKTIPILSEINNWNSFQTDREFKCRSPTLVVGEDSWSPADPFPVNSSWIWISTGCPTITDLWWNGKERFLLLWANESSILSLLERSRRG